MISFKPYIATPYSGMPEKHTMKTLAPIHRKAVNQAAHAAAVRFEIETRDRWLTELAQALADGASFAELGERIAKLSRAQ